MDNFDAFMQKPLWMRIFIAVFSTTILGMGIATMILDPKYGLLISDDDPKMRNYAWLKPYQFHGEVVGIASVCAKGLVYVYVDTKSEILKLPLHRDYDCMYSKLELGDSISKIPDSPLFVINKKGMKYTFSYDSGTKCHCRDQSAFKHVPFRFKWLSSGIQDSISD